MALDITDPTAPTFLWEQVDERADSTAIGYTTSRPVIANIYDSSDSSDPVDNYVAFWGSGRSVPYGISSSYYAAIKATFMWSIGDVTTTHYHQAVPRLSGQWVSSRGQRSPKNPHCMVPP